jgi:uncharacterized membrane protein
VVFVVVTIVVVIIVVAFVGRTVKAVGEEVDNEDVVKVKAVAEVDREDVLY